jgi:hypothetical protein
MYCICGSIEKGLAECYVSNSRVATRKKFLARLVGIKAARERRISKAEKYSKK